MRKNVLNVPMNVVINVLMPVLLVFLSAGLSFAGADITAADIDSQEKLQDLTKEVGFAISIPSLTPSKPLGLILGIDIGIEASALDITEAKDVLNDDSLLLTRVHVQKGLPFSIDVGVEYTKAADSNIEAAGAELRWALLDDGIVIPAIGIRGTYSTLLNVDDVDITTYGVDVQVSKKVIFITPYGGAGYLVSNGTVNNNSTLDSEEETNTSVYVGLKLSAILINLTLQADISDNTMYTLKFGAGF